MAILNRDDFFNRLNERIGTDSSEESIKFLEDMTDTYNDLETKAKSDSEDWKKKYDDLDKAWKAKYKSRFFSGAPMSTPNEGSGNDGGCDPTNLTIDDLFNNK